MSRGSLCVFVFRFLVAVTFFPLFSEPLAAKEHAVVINEIMYHVRETEWKEDPSAEFIELYHSGDMPISLEGWRFTEGIRYRFPQIILQPGDCLVVAADVEAFRQRHPEIADCLGPFQRGLSNRGERVTLEDADGRVVDSVRYADSGRWAVRRSVQLEGFPDWIWDAPHDGEGASLSLISPLADNAHGVNWASSQAIGGTPGQPNDVLQTSLPPVVVSLEHQPAIPSSETAVTVRAKVASSEEVSLTLHYRRDGDTRFQSVPMPEGRGEIPAMADGTVVQYYVEAKDGRGGIAEYPGVARNEGVLAPRQALHLYQVEDAFDLEHETAPGQKPTYRLVTTAAEIALLERLNDISNANNAYDNHLHVSLVVVDGAGIDVRQEVSARMRGHGSRSAKPPGLRVSFPGDAPWRGVTAINLNSQYTYSQALGAAIHQLAGFASARSTPVFLRLNGEDPTRRGAPQFGCYVHNEVFDSDYVEAHFPGEEEGNMYRLVGNANLNRRGSNLSVYRQLYRKRNHASEDDYSDLLDLIDTLAEAEPAETYFARVNQVADLEQWARYLALDALLGNTEGGLPTGRGDDAAIFRRQDGRFHLIPYDLDSILGMGERGRQMGGDVFRYGNMQGFRFLFQDPQFLELYARQFVSLTETFYRPEIIHRVIDELWAGWVPAPQTEAVKAFMEERVRVVMSQFASSTANVIGATLEKERGFYKASSTRFALYGRFDRKAIHEVRVGDLAPSLFEETGTWMVGPREMARLVRPGVNQIPVTMRDFQGNVVEEEWVRIWLDNGSVREVTGALPAGITTWTADEGPYLLKGQVRVPESARLVIEPGVTVYGSAGAGLLVEGQLSVGSKGDRRVTFALHPEETAAKGWNGVVWQGAVDKMSVLANVDLLDLDGPLRVEGARKVSLDHCKVEWVGDHGIRVREGWLQAAAGSLQQPHAASGPAIEVIGGQWDRGLTLEQMEFLGGSQGPAVRLDTLSEVYLFANRFESRQLPVIQVVGPVSGYLDGNDFSVDSPGESPVISAEAQLVLTRNRVFGRGDVAQESDPKGVTFHSAVLPPRFLAAADVRWVHQPPRQMASDSLSLQVTGEGLKAFRYRVDEGSWSESIPMEGAPVKPVTVTGLAPGKHRLALLGQHVSGRWQMEAKATVSREFEVIPGLLTVQLSEVLAVNSRGEDLLELHNFGERSFDLSGYGLSDDPDEAAIHVFPEGTVIEPRGFLVCEASKEVLGFALSAQGECLRLTDPRGQVVDEVCFGLQLEDHSVSRLENGEWGLSAPSLGAPNRPLPTATPEALRISEWFAAGSVSAPEEFIELENVRDLPVDLGGCVLTDHVPNASQWAPMPALSFVAAQERQVFYAGGDSSDGANRLGFGLSREGEVLGLLGPGGQLLDFAVFGPQAVGISQGRDDQGRLVFGQPSPGEVPMGFRHQRTEAWIEGLRISELHYHPSKEEDEEFIELVNISQRALPLRGLTFRDGIEFEFDERVLEPGACVLVVKDRRAFARRYGEAHAIAGEYSGKLSNGGERVVLASEEGETVLSLEYSDKWYRGTDGKGYSLVLVNPRDSRVDRRKDWTMSERKGGDPGSVAGLMD